MSIQACSSIEPHTGHRFGEHENYCIGQYLSADGTWRNHKLSGGRVGKPHFFVEGQKRSICGYGHKSRSKIVADVSGRNVCAHCKRAVDAGGIRTFDPEPYVGWSGARYSFSGSAAASLDDGPVFFEPRTEYAEFIAYGTVEGDPDTHLYRNRDGGDTTAFCGIRLSDIGAGFTTEPSYRIDISCDECITQHDQAAT